MLVAGAGDAQPTGTSRGGAGVGRLVCLPPAGAGASFYREWAPTVGSLRVEPVDLPGRGSLTAQPPLTSVADMAATVIRALQPIAAPWSLFGHSLGAAVAFEVARSVRARGGTAPSHLVVSGRPAPHAARTRPVLHTLPRDEFVAAVLAHGGTPPAVAEHVELMHALEPVLRADFRASETYAWDGSDPVDCPVTVVVASRDPLFVPREALLWRHATTGRFNVVHVEGDHFHTRRPSSALLDVLGEISA